MGGRRRGGTVIVAVTVVLSTWPETGYSAVMVGDRAIPTGRPQVWEQGSILVPLRPACEALGIDLTWDGATRSARGSFGGLRIETEGVVVQATTFSLWLGRSTAALGGQPVRLVASPRFVGNQLYVPAGFLGRICGEDVRVTDRVKVWAQGEPCAEGVLRDGHVLVPVRLLWWHARIDWDARSRTTRVTRDGMPDLTCQVTIGSRKASLNGQPVELAVPAELVEGDTYVPVRFLAQVADGEVEWRPEQLTVELVGFPLFPIFDH
jgi:hypothetical protein